MKSAVVALAACSFLAHAGTPTQPSPPRRSPEPDTEVIRVSPPDPSRPIRELLAALESDDASIRAAAAFELAGAGDVELDVVQALLVVLDDPVEEVRESASWALLHVNNPDLDYGRLFDAPPRPVTAVRPDYPPEAFAEKLEGTVRVAILVNAAGEVVHVEVRESIPALDEAALDSMRHWTFQPATRRGKPTPFAAVAPCGFRIF